MSYYKQYIEGLCPELKSWQVTQICGELDKRDAEIEDLKTEIRHLDEQLNDFTSA